MQEKIWRTDPRLMGRFHPRNPDHVLVLVHDGSPRLTSAQPEKVWVRLIASEADLYRGRILNTPEQVISVSQGSEIWLKPSQHLPVFLPEKYMRERRHWQVNPCEQCGFAELFDAPSELIAWMFPHVITEKQLRVFSTFCPLCGGVQVVENKAVTRFH